MNELPSAKVTVFFCGLTFVCIVFLRDFFIHRRGGAGSGPASPVARLPAYSKVWHILLALGFAGYGLHGLCTNDIWLPGRQGTNVHLHGSEVVLFFLATLCAGSFLTSKVVEDCAGGDACKYGRFRRIAGVVGWCFFGLSLSAWVYHTLNR